MHKKILSVIAISLTLVQFTFAQVGTIRGELTDGEFNDVLPFANILVKGTTVGTTSDFEGTYSLEVKPGTYTVVFSYIGYTPQEITNVVVEANKVTELNVLLQPASAQLDEVVVTTTVRKNTEASVLNLQKNSVTLMDGLSLEGIKTMGASNIASAVKRVPGVSVQDGKYVYVRGLGDRYTKSILNGMDIPGLDPDKNTVQMDIFPTNILENVIVLKSASADLPADFTGGVVNIITKDFPTQKQMSISASVGYNPSMHFQDNYLSYEGGATDFLGFDDGTRELPFPSNSDIPSPSDSNRNSILDDYTRAFEPNMAAQEQTSKPDFSLGFSYGNQFNVGDNTLGFIASLDYKNTTRFYEGFENGIYQKAPESDIYELRFDRRQRGDLGTNNVLGSALAGLSYKTGRSKYRLNLLHIQNGESRAALYDQRTEISNALDVVKDNLEYSERSVSNLLLSGKHTSEDASFTSEWSLSPTLTSVQDKDVRLTTFIVNPDGFTISSDAGFPTRLWRDLKEVNAVGKIDFAKSYSLLDNKAVFKFGGLYSYKQREYGIYNYDIAFYNFSTASLNGNPDAILLEENIWTRENNSGSYARGNFQPANSFDSNQNTAAFYLSNEFKFADRLRAIIGIRAENFTTFFTGQNNTGTEVYDEEKTISELDFFPSANFIYEVKDNVNMRLSYSKTTARPSFKELSVVQIADLLTGVLFLGNLDLQPTYIDNFDFRFEIFGDSAQMFAVSSFYKKFEDPIEIVAYDITAPNQFTPRNSPSADVLGLEFEARKNFGFISEGLQDLSLNLNVSIIDSKIEMAKGENQEYDSRQTFARDGETIDETRQLQGQSPFLVNAGLNYNNRNIGLETGVFFNVQGKTLEVVGFGQNPDVFTQPFNSLNFNFSKTFGKEQNSKITLKVNNILNDTRESLYDSFGATKQNFSYREIGTAFSLGYSLNF
ncbi:TonB-dependent receptor [Flagellimonas halotolerans]|uniref:TonB-dependent receptor n=1 Tax=Flagellimonas halotolerans TaxID=3112164 RepID=A0ABU6IP04_9FLAO|nr:MULTISPECIES: TonB-dependent receptor [unclassified Allomuricauda]MEC3964862.1 TonB-dependent receptor [Muricauda sp. SYSU M86414]MEC4264774.1 TonB-dependent receptor [Muricauda sp. SYSU M84420]